MPKESPQPGPGQKIAAAAAAGGQVLVGEEPQAIAVSGGLPPAETGAPTEKDDTPDLGGFDTVGDLLADYQKVKQNYGDSTREFQRIKPLLDRAQQLEPFLDMVTSNPGFRQHALDYPGFSGEPAAPDLPEDLGSMAPQDLSALVDSRVQSGISAALAENRQQEESQARNAAQIEGLRELGYDDTKINELLAGLRTAPPTLVDIHRSRNMDAAIKAAVDKATKDLLAQMGGQRPAPALGAVGGQPETVENLQEFGLKFKAGIVGAKG